MKLWKKGLALLMVLSITAGMVMTGSAESGLVPIDSASFPDPAFLRWVQGKGYRWRRRPLPDGAGSGDPDGSSEAGDSGFKRPGVV